MKEIVKQSPNFHTSTGVFSFFVGFYSDLEKLARGQPYVVEGFKSQTELREFARLMMAQTYDSKVENSPRSYTHTLDEGNLTYTIRRI